MGLFGPIIVGILVISLALHRGLTRRRWQAIADQLGVTLSPVFSEDDPEVTGYRDGIWFMVNRRDRACFVNLKSPHLNNLSLSKESVASKLLGDLETGDAEFDAKVRISGEESMLRALLDHRARQVVLREMVATGAVLKHGRISLKYRLLTTLASAIPGLVELAKRLEIQPEEVPARLGTNVLTDTQPGVRWLNLKTLLRDFAEHEKTLFAARGALRDRSLLVRLEAAIFLGDEAVEEVCCIAGNSSAPVELKLRAAEHLAQPQWTERVVGLYKQLLWVDDNRVRASAARSLGRLGWQPAVPWLAELLPTADSTLGKTVATALGGIGGSKAEEALGDLLSRREEVIVAAAAQALGVCGSVRWVEPLLGLVQRGGAAAKAAAEAVHRIQSLLPEAEAGELSMARTAEPKGALSPADAPLVGSLSPVSDPESQEAHTQGRENGEYMKGGSDL